ncbi:MAG: hypothetical protein HYZ75_00195 [Elusimicrobia bacterium]|nr:hypothetical protein [Elusimicrobiota bacterium]
MKDADFGLMTALGLGAATVFVAVSTLLYPSDPRMTDEPTEVVSLAAPVLREPMRDSMASLGPSMMPIPNAARDIPPARRAAVAMPVPAGVRLRPRPISLAGLLEQPSAFLMGRTVLTDGPRLRRFLADRRRVDSYLDFPLVRAVLKYPAAAKVILGNGALVRAFLDTPAMRDPAAVRELLGSALFRKLAACPGIHGALADAAVTARLSSDPRAVAFLTRHPQAALALGRGFPAMAKALER